MPGILHIEGAKNDLTAREIVDFESKNWLGRVVKAIQFGIQGKGWVGLQGQKIEAAAMQLGESEKKHLVLACLHRSNPRNWHKSRDLSPQKRGDNHLDEFCSKILAVSIDQYEPTLREYETQEFIHVVEMASEYLSGLREDIGLGREGLCRTEGSASDLEKLGKRLDEDANEFEFVPFQVSGGKASGDSADSVGALIRRLVREVVVFDTDEKKDALRSGDLEQIEQALTADEYEAFVKLLVFLKMIEQKSETNKMGAFQLAIVFAPNLFSQPRCEDDELSAVQHLIELTDPDAVEAVVEKIRTEHIRKIRKIRKKIMDEFIVDYPINRQFDEVSRNNWNVWTAASDILYELKPGQHEPLTSEEIKRIMLEPLNKTDKSETAHSEGMQFDPEGDAAIALKGIIERFFKD